MYWVQFWASQFKEDIERLEHTQDEEDQDGEGSGNPALGGTIGGVGYI